MITQGELNVAGVRAQQLSDELRSAIVIGKLNRLFGRRVRTLFYLDGPDLHWTAQRLQSTCERALGTRQR